MIYKNTSSRLVRLCVKSSQPSSFERDLLDSQSVIADLDLHSTNFSSKELILNLIQNKICFLKNLNLKSINQFHSKQDFVHGDFHNENLLFNGQGQIVRLLDFEETHIGNRIEDLFQFIFLGCCNSGYKKSNLKKAKCFLDAYRKNIHVSESEIYLGVQYALYKETSSFFLEKLHLHSKDNSLTPFLKRDLSKIQYFHKNLDNFIKALN